METKLFEVGNIVFHKSDVVGNFPMVIDEIPEYEDPENPQDVHVSYITKTGKIENTVLNGKCLRHGKGL